MRAEVEEEEFRGGPGWLATFVGAGILLAAGFALGLVVGAVREEPAIVLRYVTGQGAQVPAPAAVPAAAPAPQDAALLLRGLKTLALRMDRHCANAMAVARVLEAHPAVARVHYPGLARDPQHALACRQMRQAGGMVAFDLHGGLAAGQCFIDALELVACAVSLGDAESLAQHPATMTHSTYTAEERAAACIGDGLVRLSAGLEDTDDLVADVRRALDALPASLAAAA